MQYYTCGTMLIFMEFRVFEKAHSESSLLLDETTLQIGLRLSVDAVFDRSDPFSEYFSSIWMGGDRVGIWWGFTRSGIPEKQNSLISLSHA